MSLSRPSKAAPFDALETNDADEIVRPLYRASISVHTELPSPLLPLGWQPLKVRSLRKHIVQHVLQDVCWHAT